MVDGTRDVTLDEELLRYLSHQERPPSYEALRRVLTAANFLHLDERGVLWVTGEARAPLRRVPRLGEREKLLTRLHATLIFPGTDYLY